MTNAIFNKLEHILKPKKKEKEIVNNLSELKILFFI